MLMLFLLFSLILILRKFYLNKFKSGNNVCVLVLGDIGRSPRMQYHAISFAREGFTVDVVGYPGSSPIREISENARIQIHYLRPPPELRNKLPRLFCYIIKVIWQTADLLWLLFCKRLSDAVITQNPPAIPTIPICWFYCVLTEAQFTIDWHNYAHSIMALSLGENHILVRLSKNIETMFGCRAKNNFCVSKAMKEDLEKKWAIQAKVLYDRPTDKFHSITLTEKNKFLQELAETYGIYVPPIRSGFIVSSTSWTEDEDFSILLNALQEYENACENGELNLPDLVCVITGKGPLKDFYMAIIDLKKWKHVEIKTPWLKNEEYPKILASADLGVCLHTSSSGLDLPMKVVDMFGCRLPVCAYNFNCLSELIKHNENSLVFADEKELAEQLKMWFQDYPNNKTQQQLREKFQENMFTSQQNCNDWHSNWKLNVLPYFQK
ncbi:Chitobiosyldiphosphodolichol beta-mannosyltransferase [Trachymyrmex septentrionalis]|uniref:Chitobiosyldiphosphodolichol beta-mannosyltransferase n=1 Tax=Trachymyrmex septentrionalis TaxID=34720 RepID=A0A151K0E3_9HYME|nr:PREDICTED: chitobiosyldiphosphodolichol beta-mannosyltransferase [Trachymyrmex septentrionalis]KYN44169.1 Chitobiosyldiphosphodolichol beta-mannosyltransferase [Trachymyrmex septentrionalis]